MDPLIESRDRMDAAGSHIAILADKPGARARIVSGNDEIANAWMKGAQVWSAQEMYDYINAPAEARTIMREVKRIKSRRDGDELRARIKAATAKVGM